MATNLSTESSFNITATTLSIRKSTEGGVYPHDIFDLEARKNGQFMV